MPSIEHLSPECWNYSLLIHLSQPALYQMFLTALSKLTSDRLDAGLEIPTWSSRIVRLGISCDILEIQFAFCEMNGVGHSEVDSGIHLCLQESN